MSHLVSRLVKSVPVPPADAFDESGDYQRRLDRDLDQSINIPSPKYRGCIPVCVPSSLHVSINVESAEGTMTVIEIAVSESQFDELMPILNGSICLLTLRSVRPESVAMEMREQYPNTPFTLLPKQQMIVEKVEPNLRD